MLSIKWFLILIYLIISNFTFAQWSTDPTQNLQIDPSGQQVMACEDGKGGAFLSFLYYENFPNPSRAYVQHINAYGYSTFPKVEIKTSGWEVSPSKIIETSDHCAIISYIENWVVGTIPEPPFKIFEGTTRLNKIDSAGNLLWGEFGISAIGDRSPANKETLVPSEDGGCYLTISEIFPGIYDDVDSIHTWIQKFDKNGKKLWGDKGRFLNNPNKRGGCWISERQPNGIFLWYGAGRIIMESINPDGSVNWSKENKWYGYWKKSSTPDGGLIWATQMDIPSGPKDRIIANKMNANGNLMWSDSGIVIINEIEYPSGLGGATFNNTTNILNVTWHEYSEPEKKYSYKYQVLNRNGENLLPSGGKLFLNRNDSISMGSIIDDLFYYGDYRKGSKGLWITKLDSVGNPVWKTNAVLITKGSGRGNSVRDGKGGLLDFWSEYFSPGVGVYGQQVNKYGELGKILVSVTPNVEKQDDFQVYQNYPNPFNPETTIRFNLQKAGSARIEIYSITGQIVKIFADNQMTAGNHSVIFDASEFSSGIYFYRLVSGDFSQVKKMVFLK